MIKPLYGDTTGMSPMVSNILLAWLKGPFTQPGPSAHFPKYIDLYILKIEGMQVQSSNSLTAYLMWSLKLPSDSREHITTVGLSRVMQYSKITQ